MKKTVFLFLAAVALLTSCKTQYVPQIIERVRVDTLRQVVTQRDSIYLHDSTIVRMAGDTVFMERWHTSYRDRWHTDTLYQSRTDSVPVPYPVIKEVPADLTWWQQLRLHLANIILIALVLLALFLGIKKYFKL